MSAVVLRHCIVAVHNRGLVPLVFAVGYVVDPYLCLHRVVVVPVLLLVLVAFVSACWRGHGTFGLCEL